MGVHFNFAEKIREMLLKAPEIIWVIIGFHFRFNRDKIAHILSFLLLMIFFFLNLSRRGL